MDISTDRGSTARLDKANESGKADLALLQFCTRFGMNFDGEQLRLCQKRGECTDYSLTIVDEELTGIVSLFSWALLRHAQICKKVEQIVQPLCNLALRPAPRGCMIGSKAAFLEVSFFLLIPIHEDFRADWVRLAS